MTKKCNLKQIILLLVVFELFNGIVLNAQNLKFPYELKKSDFVLLPLGLAAYYGGESWIDGKGTISEEEIAILNRNNINKFDRHATEIFNLRAGNASDLIRTSLIIIPGFLVGHQLFDRKWNPALTLGLMYYETYLYTKGMTAMAKAITGRTRPYLYNDNLTTEERYEYTKTRDSYGSFFSGHTSATFAAATCMSKWFTDIYGKSTLSNIVWGTSITVASLGGYYRYRSGEHYPTDVLAGALFGFAIGYTIPLLHTKGKSESIDFSATPNFLYLSLKF